MSSNEISKPDNAFYSEIRELLQRARSAAYQAVNTLMVTTCRQIGKRIVTQEQHGLSRAGYGDYYKLFALSVRYAWQGIFGS